MILNTTSFISHLKGIIYKDLGHINLNSLLYIISFIILNDTLNLHLYQSVYDAYLKGIMYIVLPCIQPGNSLLTFSSSSAGLIQLPSLPCDMEQGGWIFMVLDYGG